MNVLREPVEIGKLRYEQARPGIIRGWLYTTAALIVLSLKSWMISRHTPVSAGSMRGGVVGLLMVTAGLTSVKWWSVRYRLAVWQWDDRKLRVHGFSYRWASFDHFRVQPNSTGGRVYRAERSISDPPLPKAWHKACHRFVHQRDQRVVENNPAIRSPANVRSRRPAIFLCDRQHSR